MKINIKQKKPPNTKIIPIKLLFPKLELFDNINFFVPLKFLVL